MSAEELKIYIKTKESRKEFNKKYDNDPGFPVGGSKGEERMPFGDAVSFYCPKPFYRVRYICSSTHMGPLDGPTTAFE